MSFLRRVIGRAARMEAQDEAVSECEIRAIARELGISDQHVDAALREIASDVSGEVVQHRAHDRAVGALLIGSGTAVSLAIVLASKFAGNDSAITMTAFGSVAALLASMSCAVQLKGPARHVIFQACNAVLWGCVAAAVSPAAVDLATPVFGMAAAAAGSLLIALRSRQAPPACGTSRHRTPATTVRSFRARIRSLFTVFRMQAAS